MWKGTEAYFPIILAQGSIHVRLTCIWYIQMKFIGSHLFQVQISYQVYNNSLDIFVGEAVSSQVNTKCLMRQFYTSKTPTIWCQMSAMLLTLGI